MQRTAGEQSCPKALKVAVSKIGLMPPVIYILLGTTTQDWYLDDYDREVAREKVVLKYLNYGITEGTGSQQIDRIHCKC